MTQVPEADRLLRALVDATAGLAGMSAGAKQLGGRGKLAEAWEAAVDYLYVARVADRTEET